MQYKYATERPDYTDLTSGRVFYSASGHPAFPIRLASEIFQRCVALREELYQVSSPSTLYDPCCGGAYHLSVLAYLHREQIKEIIASDVDADATSLAKRNLELTSLDGLEKRIAEISAMIGQFDKDSHRDALQSAQTLQAQLLSSKRSALKTQVFQSSATDGKTISQNIKANSIDIVFTDVPYGQHSHWHDANQDEMLNPLSSMLDALLGVLSSSSVIAIVSDKKQKVSHERYQRVEQFQVGKRRIAILKPIQ